MKKLFFVMAAVAALLTSCSKDDTFGGPTRGKVTFEVSTPELATRYGEGITATALQYAVYDMIEDATNGKLVDTGTTTLDNKHANVSIDLVEGRKYTAIFWADAGENASPYTFTPATKTVSYTDINNLTANNEAYDAFYAFVPPADIKVGQTVNVTLKRPFAQLRIETSDTDRAKKLGVEVVKTGITVNAYTSFNLETGVVGGQQNITFKPTTKASASTTVGEVTYDLISMNYLLVNTKETVDVTLNFTDDVNGTEESYVRKYSSIDVQRNYRTLVRGSILTDPTQFNVTVSEGFAGDHTANGNDSATQVVSNAQDLQDMINNAEDGKETTLVLDGDINLNVDTRAEADPSLSIPDGKNIILDLNGYTLSATESSTVGYGLINIQPGAELTIDDSTGKGVITLTATNNREWNAYSSVISNQRGKLTVNGGTIEHLGGTDMAYGIDNLTNGKSTYAETVINGGTVKSTYRAIRQFLNGVEAQNILTVNGGTIEGTNKSIWMQDPSKNANTGKLTVGAEAQLKGDVYLFVTEGSTEWPVEVSIAAAALQGESTVMYANVPTGKSVVLENGYYIVKDGYYANNVDELKAALDNAPDGTTIYFAQDITSDKAVKITEKANTKITIDGQNYKFNNAFMIYGNSGQEENAGTTIKNINFESSTAKFENDYSQDVDAFIWSNNTKNGSYWRYANDVTIENCTFTATANSAAEKVMVGVKFGQAYNIKITNSTATNMHSLLQADSCGSTVTVEDCNVVNGKNGVSFNNTKNAVIKRTEINAVVDGSYGVRHKGEVENYALTVEDCQIEAFVPVLIRNMTAKSGYTATLSGENTLTLNGSNIYQVVLSNGDVDEKTAPVAPTGSYTLTGADEFKVFPRDYVDLSQTITGNISASGTAIFVDSSVTESELGTFQFEADGQMQSMSGLVVNNATITAETGIECNTETSIYLEGATFNCNTALKIGAGNITIYAIGCDFIVPEGGKICEAATGQMLIKNCKINGEDATAEQIKELCTGGITNGIMSI